MSSLQTATFRIPIGQGIYVDIQVTGCRNPQDTVSATDTRDTGRMIAELSAGVLRVKNKYKRLREKREAKPQQTKDTK